jgi:predicted phosphate transport protein (TIGR00153 family)
MFSAMMPQRREFFDLLASHSDRVVAAANAVLRLVNALGTDSKDLAELVKEVDLNEQSGDKIKADLIALLHKSFITPISRDDIHTLIIEMDKILDGLQDVANAVGMYHIVDSTPEARELAALGADACQRLNRAVLALADKERRKDAMNYCQEVDAFESKADKVFKKAITRLFQEEGNAWEAMKLKDFYFLLENVLDYCEDASKTIEGILIENA